MKMHFCLMVPLVLLITSVSADDAKNMPNINYFTRGYNIFKGNPLQVSVSVLDPGFQESIFKLSYKKRILTPDGRYLQPDGTLISMCNSCSLAFGTKKISGTYAYRKSLSEKVSVTASGGDGIYSGSFSASADYKHVKNKTSDHSSVFTHSDASCCAYQIQTNTYTPPPFSEDFLVGVKTLTKKYDKRIYTRFINAFGTHYIRQANMGSLFGQQSRISRRGWKHMLTSNVDIDVAASFSAESVYTVEGNVTSTTSIKNENVTTFNTYTSSQTLYTKGSSPPKNGSVFSWAEQTKESPAPITFELAPIIGLFDGPYGLNVSKEVIDNMNKAVYDYCGEECSKDEAAVDPPFPDVGNWLPWLTNNYTGIRLEQFSCLDQEKSYITYIYPYYGISLSMAIGCSNKSGVPWPIIPHDKILPFATANNYTFGDPNKSNANPHPNITCTDNGFRKIRALLSPIGTICNFEAYCHDDSMQQYTYSDKIDGKFGTWTDWSSCEYDEKIMGIQLSMFMVFNGSLENYYVNDIRVQCG